MPSKTQERLIDLATAHKLTVLLAAILIVVGVSSIFVPYTSILEAFLFVWFLACFHRLARRVDYRQPWLVTLGMVVPVLNLVLLIATLIKAVRMLRQSAVQVGWWGAASEWVNGTEIKAFWNTVGPLLGLLFVIDLFAVLAPDSFRSWRNLETVARQTTIVGLGALGMTLVIIMGGIDLSIGSVVALSTVVIAWFLQLNGVTPMPLTAAVLAVVVCGSFGLLNGLLVTRLRVVPFIVTLGMMLVARGAAKGLSHEQKIDAPQTWLNGLLASLSSEQRWMLVPVGVWVLIAMSVLVALVLRYTRLGRHTFAIGSNEHTARLCGVAVNRVKVCIYTICSAFGGLAGVMQFSRLTVGDPTVAVGLELDVIAAVVIGGGSLAGGEGSILGSLVGALIMSVIRSGCSQMGLPNWVQEIITGAIIIAAVALDRFRHRKAA